VPTGQSAPWQLVHVDDVASAVALVVEQQLDGVVNVAADGWLSDTEVARLLGRKLVEVGQSTFAELLHRGSAAGISPAPPEVMPYLLHPWVLDTARLHAAGWRATRSNRDILAELAEQHGDELALGRLSVTRRAVHRTALALTAAVVGLGWAVRRWRRREVGR
jgi:nucleoside-diphosphate-sugar epimerase